MTELHEQHAIATRAEPAIPFNTQLTLVVHPSFYHVSNATGVALPDAASTKIPLLVAAGQQPPPIRLAISGAGR